MYRYALVTFAVPWLLLSPAIAADHEKANPPASSSSTEDMETRTIPGREAGQETSDRTPKKDTTVPLSQTTKTEGETSDRTPGN